MAMPDPPGTDGYGEWEAAMTELWGSLAWVRVPEGADFSVGVYDDLLARLKAEGALLKPGQWVRPRMHNPWAGMGYTPGQQESLLQGHDLDEYIF